MASYIEQNLGRDEQVIHRAKVSRWAELPKLIIGILLLLFYGLGLLIILWAVIEVLTTELAFTNKRVIGKFGWIKRDTAELRLEKVESVNVEQGVLGRILNYGTIRVIGAGSRTPIPLIHAPMSFRNRLNDYLDEIHQQQKSSN